MYDFIYEEIHEAREEMLRVVCFIFFLSCIYCDHPYKSPSVSSYIERMRTCRDHDSICLKKHALKVQFV